MTANPIYFKKNIAASLSNLLKSGGFHWMMH